LVQATSEHQIDGKWVPRGYRLDSKWTVHAPGDPPTENDVLSSLHRNEFAPLLEVRTGDGRRLRLKSSPEKTQTFDRLEAYERRLKRHVIKVRGQVLPPFLFSLTRIYKQDYTKGGRYYSAFQTRSSQFRLQLDINEAPVAEVDYKALHPNILYQLVGLEAPEDPYNVGDGFPRSAVKKAFQVLINRSKGGSATESLMFWLNENRRKGKPDPDDWEGLGIKVTRDWCQLLENRLREHLKPIEHFFCQGVGLQLQHFDSELVSRVIDYFMVKTDSITIPIHDSFLVKQSDLPVLIEAIKYAEVTLAREMKKAIRVPTLKVEVSKPQQGYASTVKALGEHLKQSIKEEDQKPDLSGLEAWINSNQKNDLYLFDFQIEQDTAGEEED